jgi:ketosteroid isomerase-like protein
MAKLVKLALIVIVGSCCWAQQAAPTEPAASEKLAQIRQEYLRAFNAKDVDAILALYAEDATLASDGGTFKGRAEIRVWLLSGIDQGSRLLAIEPGVVKSSGALAYETGRTKRQVGAQIHLGQYLMVMERIDGEWKITQHFSVSAGVIPAV